MGSFAAFIAVVTLAGMAYGRIAHARQLRQLSPPGQMVIVDGHRLHIHCSGEGSPTVVLEAGSGSWSSDSRLVQPAVADITRVCSYDRAGYGWSEPGPTPRTAAQIASELHTLLENAEVDEPYVLVGHSLGGIYTRVYMGQYPDQVAGMVLVDARHEDYAKSLPLAYQEAAAASEKLFSALEIMSRLGLLQLLGPFFMEEQLQPILQYLPPEAQHEYLTMLYQAKFFRAVLDEGAVVEESDAQAHSAGSAGDRPLAVVTHGIANPAAAGITEQQAAELEETWQDLQRELTELSSESVLIVAEESGHMIPLEQPEVVVEAIRQVVEAVRR